MFEISDTPPKSLSFLDRHRLFSLSHRERVGVRGSKASTKVFDLIPLILTFSRREKGLADLSKSFCMTLAE